MIEIAGLTLRQKNIMDLLWGCNDLDQVRTLIAALPTKQDQNDATSLIEMVTCDAIEEELGLEAYETAALDVIRRCR